MSYNNICYHCLQECESTYSYVYNYNKYFFCCSGCCSVFNFIVNNGFFSYYELREELPTLHPKNLDSNFLTNIKIFSNDSLLTKDFPGSGVSKVNLVIEGISCAACTWLIEQLLLTDSSIHRVSINFVSHRGVVYFYSNKISIKDILKKVYDIGYLCYPFTEDSVEEMSNREYNVFLKRLAVSGLGTMQVMMCSFGLYAGDLDFEYQHYLHIVSLLLTTPIVFYSSKPFFVSAYRVLLNFSLNMDVPICFAVFISYFFSVYSTYIKSYVVYYDSISMFIFFILLGRFVELQVRYKSFNLINYKFLSNIFVVSKVSKTSSFFSFVEDRIGIEDINIGYWILVKSRFVVPCDGILMSSKAVLNESILTGEELPVYKSYGDLVYGGSSIVNNNDIVIEAVAKSDYSKVSRIKKYLNTINDFKPGIVLLANQISKWFILFVLIISLVAFFYWYFIDFDRVFYVLISILIATCPCALSLATPVAFIASTYNLLSKGFLIVNMHVLESLSKVNSIIFDKTGTLTDGNFYISRFFLVSNVISIYDIFKISYLLEYSVNHPFYKCFKFYVTDFLSCNSINVVSTVYSSGVEGYYYDSLYRIGKPSFVNMLWGSFLNFSLHEKINYNYVLLGYFGGPISFFIIRDNIRSDLRLFFLKNSFFFNFYILSGDSICSVKDISINLQLKNVFYNVSINKKLSFIKLLQKNKDFVMMVGDGVNDVPALVSSNLSVSVCNGSDLSKVSSDIVLLNNKLSLIDYGIKQSYFTKRIIIQNFLWSLVYNIIILPLAFFGYMPPYLSAIGMSFSSLLVVFNSFRLFR